jgi:hypothetical protein
MCPADYRYPPSIFDRSVELAADVVYVAGGLYGNLAALDAIEQLAAREGALPLVVFNGDFHWFDAEPAWFTEIDRRVKRHPAIRGNIETELARESDIGAGCGCAYPESVAENLVRRSNEILVSLRLTAQQLSPAAARLGRLPMHLVAQVGGLRIAIVHGDATSLAGWTLTPDALDGPAASGMLNAIRRMANIDVIASTHTCLAVLRDFMLPSGRLTVINNGAAGMPNFSDTRFGLISRIATTPSPHATVYGLEREGVHVDAILVAYDHNAFVDRFLARWPEGSAAHASYFRRISMGPDYPVALARPSARGIAA